MRTSPHHRHNGAPGAGDFSRRAILAGTVATTAVATVLPVTGSADAEAPDTNSRQQDMMAFLLLSAALAGVHVVDLAPEFTRGKDIKDILDEDPGIDPINIKDEYFAWIKANDPTATFGKLLQIAKDHRRSATDIIAAVNASNDDTKFLARSIVLLWYLGSWYCPADLKTNFASPGGSGPIPSQVVSAKAYTQGLIWQIVGAHPMGYSNLQFGYWSRDPNDPNNPAGKSNLGLIATTIP